MCRRYTHSMRVVQFLQVVTLFVVLGYAVLVALVNPVTLHLPLPFMERELLVSAGGVLLWALVLGTAYGAFLLLPLLMHLRSGLREAARRRMQAEENLQLTLRARLGLEPAPSTAPTEAQP